MKPKLPPIKRLRELFEYDANTGGLAWRVRRGPVRIGSAAGSLHRSGYYRVIVDGIRVAAHRVAWALHHNQWPADQIDHINGNKVDNRIINLREATNLENNQNRAANVGSVSKYVGVVWHKGAGKWQAQIGYNGKRRYLGMFRTEHEAHDAYCAAKRELHKFQPIPRNTNSDLTAKCFGQGDHIQ
ncbi:HNH endonuclease [Xanthomonas sp. NCPPB 3005]|uniref:HNH endonuclease n=1 Tax=Xanthomonas sp. NCPPB 3005 TaxID=3240913 RepID=UPI003513468E